MCTSADFAVFAGNWSIKFKKTTNMFERDHCLLIESDEKLFVMIKQCEIMVKMKSDFSVEWHFSGVIVSSEIEIGTEWSVQFLGGHEKSWVSHSEQDVSLLFSRAVLTALLFKWEWNLVKFWEKSHKISQVSSTTWRLERMESSDWLRWVVTWFCSEIWPKGKWHGRFTMYHHFPTYKWHEDTTNW